jgi:hypothetical protein
VLFFTHTYVSGGIFLNIVSTLRGREYGISTVLWIVGTGYVRAISVYTGGVSTIVGGGVRTGVSPLGFGAVYPFRVLGEGFDFLDVFGNIFPSIFSAFIWDNIVIHSFQFSSSGCAVKYALCLLTNHLRSLEYGFIPYITDSVPSTYISSR